MNVIPCVVGGHQAGQGGPAAVCSQQQHDFTRLKQQEKVLCQAES